MKEHITYLIAERTDTENKNAASKRRKTLTAGGGGIAVILTQFLLGHNRNDYDSAGLFGLRRESASEIVLD